MPEVLYRPRPEMTAGVASPVLSLDLTSWKPQTVTAKQDGSAVVVTLAGNFNNGKTDKDLVAVDGTMEFRIAGDGSLAVKYDWIAATPMGSNQYACREIGLSLNLARSKDVLTWKRRGQWTVYPDDHIGRTEGRASAFRDPSGKADDPARSPPGPILWIRPRPGPQISAAPSITFSGRA